MKKDAKMDEIRNTPEELESGAVRDSGQQALDDATYEPSAYIEHGGDFQQAEDIQNNFVALTANAAAARDAEQVSSLPVPIPKPVEAAADGEKVGHLPIPLPKPAEETAGAQEISSLPVPIPKPAKAAAGAEEAGVLPLPLPKPDEKSTGVEKAGVLPVPIPKPAEETVLEEPPGDHEPLSRTEPPGEEEEDKDKATPINIPGPRMREERDNMGPALIPENDDLPDAASGGEEEEGNDKSKASEDDWETPIV
jgi:hypothetical protein